MRLHSPAYSQRKRSVYGARSTGRRRAVSDRPSVFVLFKRLLLGLLRFVLLVVVALGIPTLALQSYFALMASDAFVLEQISVDGITFIDKDELLARADLRPGINLFDLDTERIESVLASDPWVVTASVERSFPHDLHIHIREHKPVALYVDGDQWQLIGSSGVPFKSLEPTDPVDQLSVLPLMTGPEIDDLNNEGVRQRMLDAIELVETYHELGLDQKAAISEVHLDAELGLSLYLEPGVLVRLGDDRYPERLQRLDLLLAALEQREMVADYILMDQETDLNKATVGRHKASS